mmetsp:Transcript_50732/g.110221  ORF Transcript_50732/g.110221 Transcript_50732/m.110221 type:complete len:96 (-) Transcript_50732:28-315(-)|eukprot:CAMPEP_0175816156 /NCGR_PEP_ID=MMETSP0107_2-20121207/6350_1 /TAXON_ID=195067 ORGANISM="Goniomonas pacifica, Strain CCMP1869" /NCGR_SAMPLE_ID=MMETSP0107_2 /ASSEMBLY_ACC=CAM_ASM_000203 /LENGTH=95 /DNA_ID=CAMNT_0017128247 /DNA_START=16 /DNA_END=303 /DNA_ORIENTATION=+
MRRFPLGTGAVLGFGGGFVFMMALLVLSNEIEEEPVGLSQLKGWNPFQPETNVWGADPPFQYAWRTPAPTPAPCEMIRDPIGNELCDIKPDCQCP